MFWEDYVPTPRIIWFKFVFDWGGVGMVHIVTSTCKILHIQYQVTIISSTGLNPPNLIWFCTHPRGLGLQLRRMNLDKYCLQKMKKHIFFLFLSIKTHFVRILYCRFWSEQLKLDLLSFGHLLIKTLYTALYFTIWSKMLSPSAHFLWS